jgi:hypothetical protein
LFFTTYATALPAASQGPCRLGPQLGPHTDEPEDLWRQFTPGANTSIFGKVDAAFGNKTEGVAAKGERR